MDNLSKKISYLKGYADGLDISPKSSEGKLLSKMLELLGEMADAIDELAYEQAETQDVIDELDEAVFAMAEDIYGEDDYDFDEDGEYDDDVYGDDDDFLDDYDGEYDGDDGDYFEIQCPNCGEDVMIDFDMIDSEDAIVCPNCHEEIELEIDFECDDDDCDCGHDHDED